MSEYSMRRKMNAITFRIINYDTPEYRATVALRYDTTNYDRKLRHLF
jgi:hypothetical protein